MEAPDGSGTKRSTASRLLISCGLVFAPVWLAFIVLLGKNIVDAVAPLISEPPAPAPPVPAPAPRSTLPPATPSPEPTPAPAGGGGGEEEEVASLRRQLAQERRSRQRALAAEAAMRRSEAALRAHVEGLEAALVRTQASNESKMLIRNLTEAEERLLEAEAASAADRHRITALEGRVEELESLVAESGGPVAESLRGVEHQQALAVVLGAIGALGIGGPSSVVRAFLAVMGSAVGGLLLGSSVGFLATSLSSADPPDDKRGGGLCWLDALQQLLSGQAGGWSYTLAGLGLALGVLRWLVGFEYALFVVVDEVYTCRPVADVYLRKPLLGHDSQEDGGESLDSECSASTRGHGTPVHATLPKPQAAATPSDAGAASTSGGARTASRGLERLQEVALEASRAASAGDQHWPGLLWSGVDAEVRAGEVDDDIVALLAAHGYNPGRASDSIVPSLEDLCQDLAEAARCRQRRSVAAAAAANVLLGGGALLQEEISSESSRQQPPSLSDWPPPHDIPSATPPQRAGVASAPPPRLAAGHAAGAPPPPVGGLLQGSSRSSSVSSAGRRFLRRAPKDMV